MLGVLRGICTVVGAIVLYCAIVVALWYVLIGAGRRRGHKPAGRRAAERRAAERRAAERRAAEPAELERAARSWADLPSSLAGDRPWAVAVVLLGAPVVRDRTASFVDVANRTVDWPALLEDSRAWPADQRALVQSAYELSVQIRRGRLEPEDGITTLS